MIAWIFARNKIIEMTKWFISIILNPICISEYSSLSDVLVKSCLNCSSILQEDDEIEKSNSSFVDTSSCY